MSTTIMRSALEFWGHNPAPDVARVEIDHPGGDRRVVTWADVMRERREDQAWRLANKTTVRHPWRAYRLWVAYFDQDIFGGWHAFLDDFRGDRRGRWLTRYRDVPDRFMRLFPAGLVLGDSPYDRLQDWLPAFAKLYRRGTHCRRPRGRVYLWWDGRGEPRRIGDGPPRPGRRLP